MKTVIEMAREVYGENTLWTGRQLERLEQFSELVRDEEREAITEEWSMCVQADLEHGVESLNEKAAEDWFKNYPEISKFWAWLDARSST